MALAKSFEELEIWKLARVLVKNIYADFSNSRDYSFTNQIQSAAVSIMNNIAEGFSRESKKEFHQFLNIAKGSAGEVKSMYYVAEDLQLVNQETAQKRRDTCDHIKNSIARLMKHLKS